MVRVSEVMSLVVESSVILGYVLEVMSWFCCHGRFYWRHLVPSPISL